MRAENLLLDSRIFLDKEQLSLNPHSSGGLSSGLDYIYFFLENFLSMNELSIALNVQLFFT